MAGLIDPQDSIGADAKQRIKDIAVRFCGALPQVFGDALDRTTLWDRIGSGIQSAYAKTAGDDTDFFVAQVLDHIKAEPTKSLSCDELASVLTELAEWTPSERQAWLTHLATHMIPTLVFAKAKWEDAKKTRRKQKVDKSPNAIDREHIASFINQE